MESQTHPSDVAVDTTKVGTPPIAYNPGRIRNYYDEVHKAAWVRRTAGIFAGATAGIMLGAAVGLALAFLPYALVTLGVAGITAPGVSALVAPMIIAKSAAMYAAIGGFMGVGVGAAVGESAGAVAGGLAIREHQEDQAQVQQPVIATQQAKSAGPSGPKYFSWRPAAFFATICSGFGAMVGSLAAATGPTSWLSAGTFNMFLAAVPGVAIAPFSAAAIAGTAAVFGVFGLVFGVKVGRITSDLSNFYTKVLTDDWGKRQEVIAEPSISHQPVVLQEHTVQKEVAIPAPELPAPEVAAPPRRFTETTAQKSLQPEQVAALREQMATQHLR